MSKVPDNVVDKELYKKVRNSVKRRVKSWPSAYASGQVVQEYKRKGGRYKKGKNQERALERWFDEKWIDVCTGKPCGRKGTSTRKYPYCRPTIKVNSSTPKTADTLTKKQKEKLCAKKRRNPEKRVK